VPKAEDVHTTIAMIDPIDDSIRANNNLPNARVFELSNDATHLGKFGEPLDAADEKLTEPHCAIW
jgi:hypothetical protein